jgi:plastocyanin
MESNEYQQNPIVSNHKTSKMRGAWLWIALAALPIIVIAGALIMWSRSDDTSASKAVKQAREAQAEEITIDLTANGPSPATVTINKGQAITWENKDNHSHRLTADQAVLPGLDSTDALAQGDSYTYTFEDTGTFHYYDPFDPTSFNGTVTVE